MTAAPEAEAIRRRRLRLRAGRRGMRELDLLLGGYAESALDGLDGPALDAFEALLAEPDRDVLDWLLGRSPPPAAHAGILARIRAEATGRGGGGPAGLGAARERTSGGN